MNISSIKWIVRTLIVFVVLAKFYDLSAPWKRKDHYNFGGVYSTQFAECMKTTPMSVSKGIVHHCAQSPIIFYKNHPPTYIHALNLWTQAWRSTTEATYRSFTILFSILNIFLVYLIARKLANNKDSIWPDFAALAQASFLFGLYFGSHMDFISEFPIFFLLLAWLAHVHKKIHWACLFTIISGLISWAGFFGFAALFVSQWWQKRRVWPIILWSLLGAFLGLALMAHLNQSVDLISFLKSKLVNPGYVEATQKKNAFLWPFIMTYKFIADHSRLLGPGYLMLLFLALPVFIKKSTLEQRSALLPFALTGAIYFFMGLEYFYVHPYLYLYFTPLFALLIGWYVAQFFTVTPPAAPAAKWLWAMSLLVLATYSYGLYQTSLVHDATNSVLILISVPLLAFSFFKVKEARFKAMLSVLALLALINTSQMINYRNEKPLDFEFCTKAKQEYEKTRSPVRSPYPDDFTLRFYCRGIPLDFSAQ